MQLYEMVNGPLMPRRPVHETPRGIPLGPDEATNSVEEFSSKYKAPHAGEAGQLVATFRVVENIQVGLVDLAQEIETRKRTLDEAFLHVDRHQIHQKVSEMRAEVKKKMADLEETLAKVVLMAAHKLKVLEEEDNYLVRERERGLSTNTWTQPV
jgi:hypothetical protein